MTSINTNSSAISALSNLRTTNSGLDASQSRVASGLRVGTSTDNAAYWSIATTMRSDNRSLSAVEDALGLGAAMVNTSSTGMAAAIDVMDNIKAKLVAAREPGVDRNKINAEIEEMRDQLVTIADGSSFNRSNWLSFEVSSEPWLVKPIELVASVSRNGGEFGVETLRYERNFTNSPDTPFINALVDASAQTHGEYGILTSDVYAYDLGYSNGYTMVAATGATSVPNGTPVLPQVLISVSNTSTNQEIEEMISVTDAMLMDMTETATILGTASSRIGRQDNFVADLRQTMDKGIGRLVDADMTEESARMRALQTQQNLGITSLSIANQSPQSVVSLYQ
jgi:flagellin